MPTEKLDTVLYERMAPRNYRLIDIQRFIPTPQEVISQENKFSHTVSIGTLRGEPGKTWFKKEMGDPAVARMEVLAQEFFRLLIPHQPETRLAIDATTGVHFVLSEKVNGYHNLPKEQPNLFADGTYQGLGQILVNSLFFQEIDLKNGNVGLNDRNQVTKIDGDWCFAEGRFGSGYKITAEGIAALPYPKDFYAYNWLDLREQDISHTTSHIVNPELSQAPQFRAEVNQAMLKICLMPDSFIEKFVDAYIPAGAQKYIDLIKVRREELRTSALQNPSFQAYLQTAQAAEDAKAHLKQMATFSVNQVRLLLLPQDRLMMLDGVQEMAKRLPTGSSALQEVIETARMPALQAMKQQKVVDYNFVNKYDVKIVSTFNEIKKQIQEKKREEHDDEPPAVPPVGL